MKNKYNNFNLLKYIIKNGGSCIGFGGGEEETQCILCPYHINPNESIFKRCKLGFGAQNKLQNAKKELEVFDNLEEILGNDNE